MKSTAGKGGTFCRFTIGRSERGASARRLRYIANPQSVRDGREGAWMKALPKIITEAAYPVMVRRLCQYAAILEDENIIGHKARGEARTFYGAILGFEISVSTGQAKQMIAQWVEEVFPKTRAAAFVHRNTARLHVHVWIAATQTDGRKINLTARAFRQIDEQWNRVYCRAMNRDEREHLLKKWETERYKQLIREGKTEGLKRPERVGHHWRSALFNARERARLEIGYDGNEKSAGSHKLSLTGKSSSDAGRERNAPSGERSVEASTQDIEQALEAARQTVSDTQRLYQDAQRLAFREPERQRALEPEGRER